MKRGKLALAAGLASLLTGAVFAADILTPDSPDPWLWLTDIHGAKPLAWVKDQNAKTFAVLKNDPDYQADYGAILSVLNANDRIALGTLEHGDVLNFWQDAQHKRGLWRKTSAADYRSPEPHWAVLLDVDKLDAEEHADWVWQDSDCAPRMTRCLLSLSPGGSDATAVREFDPASGKFPSGGFNLPVAKSNVAYVDENTILFGTDFGPGTMTASSYPRIVKLWHRGETLSAAKTVLEGKTTDVWVRPLVFRGPYGTVPLVVRGLTFFTSEYYYVLPDGGTMKLPLPPGADVKGVTKGNLIFTLRDDWTPAGASRAFPKGSLMAFAVKPFVMMKMRPAYALLATPDARGTIDDAVPGRDAVFASIYENVTGSIHAFSPRADGSWSDTTLAMPKGGSARIVSADDWGPEAHFTYESFLAPVTLYGFEGNGEPRRIRAEPARFDAAEFTSEQFEAKSADGTMIPYFLIRPKAAKGPVPTILYSYGGFELSLTPWYWNDGHRPLDPGRPWLEKGGAIAVANIRGGGEFGPAWHQAALKLNRQRAFDDFEAVAADLAQRGFATARQIGSVGASNGGLLVTATMVQRPDLFGAVVCQRPLIDMLRYTHFGAGASWEDEYGDPADPVMRAAILKYSPYENVKPAVAYPPIFFITETSDDRVTPVFARMMAAKMEAMKKEVLFYESPEGGHGPGATHEEQAQMWALSYVYLKQKLGLGAPAVHAQAN